MAASFNGPSPDKRRECHTINNIADQYLQKSVARNFTSLRELCDNFSYSIITFHCSTRGSSPSFIPDWLSRQLSTALFSGDQSAASRPELNPRLAVSTWNPPSAADVVLRQRAFPDVDQGVRRPARLAQPFSIDVDHHDARRAKLSFSISLFGYAAQWSLAVAELLTSHLIAGQQGKQAGHNSGFQLIIDDRQITFRGNVPLPHHPSRAVLQVLTPIAFRSGDSLLPFNTLFTRLLDCQEWLAPWMGGRLELPRAKALLQSATTTVRAQMRSTTVRIRKKNIPATCWTGSAVIDPIPVELWPLLLLGEISHVGGRTSEGLGRYKLDY